MVWMMVVSSDFDGLCENACWGRLRDEHASTSMHIQIEQPESRLMVELLHVIRHSIFPVRDKKCAIFNPSCFLRRRNFSKTPGPSCVQ